MHYIITYATQDTTPLVYFQSSNTPRQEKLRSRTSRRWNHLVESFPKTYRLVLESHSLRSNRALKIGPGGGILCGIPEARQRNLCDLLSVRWALVLLRDKDEPSTHKMKNRAGASASPAPLDLLMRCPDFRDAELDCTKIGRGRLVECLSLLRGGVPPMVIRP